MFCGKCGTPLDEASGLCPQCDAAVLQARQMTPKFCNVCGGAIDQLTGKCPQCANRKQQQSALAAKQSKKKTQVATTVATCALAFLFAVFVLAAVTVGTLRSFMTKESAEYIVDNIEWSTVIELISEDDKDEFYQYFNRECDAYIDDDVLEDFLDESATKKFLVSKITKIMRSIPKCDDVSITEREIIRLLVSNGEFFQDRLNVMISETAAQGVAEFITYGDEPVIETGMIEEEAPAVYWLLYIASYDAVWITLLVLLIILAAVMLWNSFTQGMLAMGIIATTIGTLFLIVTGLAHTELYATLTSTEAVGAIFSAVIGRYWMPSLLIFGAGILMIATQVICKKIAQKRCV